MTGFGAGGRVTILLGPSRGVRGTGRHIDHQRGRIEGAVTGYGRRPVRRLHSFQAERL